ncbi:MAG TPA: MOSC N-terminal beta barrel domain-containing protein [Candidatus Binataceae bacterium]|nr:MOSC N-terminal beta barrel domain-containing protein [Candidatus Binataceae bacterium]
MERRQIGVVGALWRYPVKSMLGEQLSRALITPYGLAGDRVWALRESQYGGVVSARTWPAMLQMRAAATPNHMPDVLDGNAADVSIEMPDGSVLTLDGTAAGDSAASRTLSDFLQREVRLERVRREPITPAEREAIMRGESLPPARDFFDEEVLHLIATGTLAHLRRLAGGTADFDPRRFRANIVVDTGAAADDFIEDGWLDGALEIGAQVRIVGMRPALRCAITTHSQEELPHDAAILRTAWRFHQAYAGIFAAVGAEGTIRVGDPIYLRPLGRGAD